MPERVTEYERDGHGRVARSVEYVESPWDEQQRGLMIALAEWDASRCSACGGDPAECQDPMSDANNPYGAWVYDAEWVECNRASAAHRLTQGPEDRRALIPRVSKRRRGSTRAKR